MRLDGKITHGMVMDVESVGADNISFVFGPVGAYIDPSLYYTKEEIDAMLANLGAQSDWDESDSSSKAYIKNKPELATVATSGSYDDLEDRPTIPTVPTNVSAFINDAGYLNGNFCPIIEDTRSSAVAAITGVAPFSTLEDKQKVIIHLAYATGDYTTLQLTLNDGITTTNAIPIYARIYATGVGQIQDGHFRGGTYMELIYNSSQNRWYCLNLDRDTTTWAMSQTEINNASNTDPRSVPNAKLIHDNAYIVELSYSSGSLKANKMYDFGTVSSALTIPSLDATNDLVSNALNFYALHFIAGADNLSITFPTGVIVDDEPTINTGDYVEIMINKYGSNFYASIKVWQAQ